MKPTVESIREADIQRANAKARANAEGTIERDGKITCPNCGVSWYDCTHLKAVANAPSPTKPSTFEQKIKEFEWAIGRYRSLNNSRSASNLTAARKTLVSAYNELEERFDTAKLGGNALIERIAELEAEIKARGEIYGAMCERLHGCCQKYHLGLGGEHVDRLVIEEVSRLRERIAEMEKQSPTPEEARYLIRLVNYAAMWHPPTPEIFSKLGALADRPTQQEGK